MLEILKNKKAIFFDIGFTLDYPLSGDFLFTKKFIEVIGEKYSVFSKEELRNAWNFALKYLEENHLVKDVDLEIKQFTHFYKEVFDFLHLNLTEKDAEIVAIDRATNMKNYVAYDDTVEVVKTLSKTHKIGLISDTWPSVKEQLIEVGIFDYVSAYTFSCNLGVFKPNELMYKDALNQIGCKPEDAVFVDDSIVNLKGAEKLGITPILIVRNPKAEEAKDIIKIHSLSELIK